MYSILPGCFSIRGFLAALCVMLCLGLSTPAQALLTVGINSPANGISVTPGQIINVSVTASGAVAGIQRITVSGTRDSSGNDVFDYPYSPPTNYATVSALYVVPLDATNGESLTISAQALGYGDDPANAYVTVIADVGAAPANDNFADRIVITGASGSVTGTNVNATRETGEPYHAGSTAGRSVWWTWTAPASGDVTFDTFGSSFDTVLGVYTGSSVGALSLVASNDDSSPYLQSKVTFTAASGISYQIAVAGYYSYSAGDITLNWDQPAADPNMIAVGGSVGGAAYDGPRNRLYVSNLTANRVDAYDLATRTSVQNWTTTGPRGLDVSPDGTQLVIAGTNCITLVDLVSGSVVGTVSTVGVNDDGTPYMPLFFGPDRVLVGVNDGQWELPLLYTPSTQVTTTYNTGIFSGDIYSEPHRLARAANHQKFVLGDGGLTGTYLYVLDTSLAVTANRSYGYSTYGRSLDMNQDGSRIVSDYQLLDSDLNEIMRFPTSSDGHYFRSAKFLPNSGGNFVVQYTGGGTQASHLEIWSESTMAKALTIPLSGQSDYADGSMVLGASNAGSQELFLLEPSRQRVRIVTITQVNAADSAWSLYE